MPCNFNNFQHIEKNRNCSVDYSILHISLKFQVDRIKIVRVILLTELKNAVLRKTRFRILSELESAKNSLFQSVNEVLAMKSAKERMGLRSQPGKFGTVALSSLAPSHKHTQIPLYYKKISPPPLPSPPCTRIVRRRRGEGEEWRGSKGGGGWAIATVAIETVVITTVVIETVAIATVAIVTVAIATDSVATAAIKIIQSQPLP